MSTAVHDPVLLAKSLPRAAREKRWWLIALLLSASLLWPEGRATAFTDEEAKEIFRILDPDHHGRVTEPEFEMNKMHAFYYRRRPIGGKMKPLTFEETGLSRAFFDQIDHGHKGYLDPIDIHDAVRFEDIDAARRGYFDFGDLVVFLSKIGR